MSVEDINYLKNNSIKQSYTFLIDSKDRDRSLHPHPNHYVVDFTVPFKNVISLEVIDASIPRTMYNVDVHNNTLYFYIAQSDDDLYYKFGMRDIVRSTDGKDVSYKDVFKKITIEPGDYTSTTFISTFNNTMRTAGYDLNIKAFSNPPELSNLIQIYSATSGFILDMYRSTLFEILGFDLYIDSSENDKDVSKRKYTYISSYKEKPYFMKMYHSVYNPSSKQYVVVSPGIIYFMGHKYIVLRCPEIEEHLYRSLSYSKYNLGLAKFRISSFGYNDERIVITKLPIREFHPIGKLARLTFRFETNQGQLYDFKGVNHNIVFAVYYYEVIQKTIPTGSILNPEYKMNYLDYLYEEEEDSDEEEEEYSRDDIEIYKKKELEYDENGMKLKNMKIL